MIDPLIRQAAEALFGPHWQTELARSAGVTDRTVRRWVAGTSPVPAGLYAELADAAAARAQVLTDLADKLREKAP